jgi:hypothetical protein
MTILMEHYVHPSACQSVTLFQQQSQMNRFLFHFIYLNRWEKYFCQLLNLHGVRNVRQTEIHRA